MSDNNKPGEEPDKKIGPYVISTSNSQFRKNFRPRHLRQG